MRRSTLRPWCPVARTPRRSVARRAESPAFAACDVAFALRWLRDNFTTLRRGAPAARHPRRALGDAVAAGHLSNRPWSYPRRLSLRQRLLSVDGDTGRR